MHLLRVQCWSFQSRIEGMRLKVLRSLNCFMVGILEVKKINFCFSSTICLTILKLVVILRLMKFWHLTLPRRIFFIYSLNPFLICQVHCHLPTPFAVVFIGSTLFALQQLSGINAVFYFSSTVFRRAGVSSNLANVFVGIANLTGTD